METLHTPSKKSNKRIIGILGGIALLMLTFLILQLTIGTGIDGQGFNWTSSDFIIIGFLLLGTGLSCEFALRRIKSSKNRIFICVAIFILLVLTWMELAVGIFGTPFAGS